MFRFAIVISDPNIRLPIYFKYFMVPIKLHPVKTKNVMTIEYIRLAFIFFKLCVSKFL
jgi:hypothetical protein